MKSIIKHSDEGLYSLAARISDLVSRYGDEYEIKDQMEHGQTREDYFKNFTDETYNMLCDYKTAQQVMGYLSNFLHDNEEAEKQILDIMNAITETYPFRLGMLANEYSRIELACENNIVLADIKGIYCEDREGSKFPAMLADYERAALDTPEGRSDILQALDVYSMKVGELGVPDINDGRLITTKHVEMLAQKIKDLGEETEFEYIARKAHDVTDVGLRLDYDIRNDFENPEVRNTLVGILEQYAKYTWNYSMESLDVMKLMHSDKNEKAILAANLIDRICDYEENQLSRADYQDELDALLSLVLNSPVYDREKDHQRTYFSVGQYEAIKKERDDVCIKLFSSHSNFANIHTYKGKADVTFLNNCILTDKQTIDVANEIGKYLKEPLFYTKYHFPNHKDVAIEALTPSDDKDFVIAEMDDNTLLECLDRISVFVDTDGSVVDFGADFIEERPVEAFINTSTEQLYIGFENNGKHHEIEIPLAPNEKAAVTALLDEYEKSKGKEERE